MNPNDPNAHVDVLAVEQKARQMRADAVAAGFKAALNALRALIGARPGHKARTA